MKNLRLITIVLGTLPLLSLSGSSWIGTAEAAGSNFFVYFGSYTAGSGQGIYVSRLDTGTGKLTTPELAAEIPNPSFLTLHPGRKFLYAVSEIDEFNGKRSGAVIAFAIDPASGKLKLLNKVASRGAGPCHLIVDKSGKNVLVANYGGGSVAVLPIQADGSLGEATAFIQHTGSSVDKERQGRPHAHSINVSADNKFAFAADLGLDKILIYRFDAAKGSLVPNDPAFGKVAPGSGPRHFAFHPNGQYAYVINEMKCTVTAFAYDPARGALKEIQTITTFPADFKAANDTAEIQVHPSGKFLYGSNRGHDSIVVFAIDPASGMLKLVENTSTQGKTPRNFGIDPTGTYLIAANQDSNDAVVFRIDPDTGRLTPTGQTLRMHAPVCVKFLPAQ